MYNIDYLNKRTNTILATIAVFNAAILTNCAGTNKFLAPNNHDFSKTTEITTTAPNNKIFSIPTTKRWFIPKITEKQTTVIKDFSPPNYAYEDQVQQS